jgi:hypothetical protein
MRSSKKVIIIDNDDVHNFITNLSLKRIDKDLEVEVVKKNKIASYDFDKEEYPVVISFCEPDFDDENLYKLLAEGKEKKKMFPVITYLNMPSNIKMIYDDLGISHMFPKPFTSDVAKMVINAYELSY